METLIIARDPEKKVAAFAVYGAYEGVWNALIHSVLMKINVVKD
ncbi:hypothetical protein [Bacillus shivajii]|nr:hypothetical protein [Bacillus shivajii]